MRSTLCSLFLMLGLLSLEAREVETGGHAVVTTWESYDTKRLIYHINDEALEDVPDEALADHSVMWAERPDTLDHIEVRLRYETNADREAGADSTRLGLRSVRAYKAPTLDAEVLVESVGSHCDTTGAGSGLITWDVKGEAPCVSYLDEPSPAALDAMVLSVLKD